MTDEEIKSCKTLIEENKSQIPFYEKRVSALDCIIGLLEGRRDELVRLADERKITTDEMIELERVRADCEAVKTERHGANNKLASRRADMEKMARLLANAEGV